MYGSGNRGDYQPTTRRGPLIVIGAVVVVLTLLVVLLVVVGGGSEESGESAPSAADAPPATNPAADYGETTYEQTTAPATPETTSSEDEEEESGSEGEGENASGTPVSSEGDGPGDSEDQQESGSGAGAPEGGAMNEPGGFDPLNKNAKPGDLTETDKGRARLAVFKFISSAYGYSGEDQTAYVRGVERNIDSTSFYQSPAGEEVKENSDKVGTQGMSAAATLEDFQIEATEPEEVVGTAYFVTGDSSSRTGEIEGEKTYYKQQITLAPDGEIFKVSSASKKVEGR